MAEKRKGEDRRKTKSHPEHERRQGARRQVAIPAVPAPAVVGSSSGAAKWYDKRFLGLPVWAWLVLVGLIGAYLLYEYFSGQGSQTTVPSPGTGTSPGGSTAPTGGNPSGGGGTVDPYYPNGDGQTTKTPGGQPTNNVPTVSQRGPQLPAIVKRATKVSYAQTAVGTAVENAAQVQPTAGFHRENPALQNYAPQIRVLPPQVAQSPKAAAPQRFKETYGHAAVRPNESKPAKVTKKKPAKAKPTAKKVPVPKPRGTAGVRPLG